MEINETNLKLVETSNEDSAISDVKSEADMDEELEIEIVSSDEINNEPDDNLDDITTNRQTKKKRPKPPVIFRCEICQEEFPNENMLKEHLDTHDFQYICETCDGKFKLAMNFIDHVREHRDDKVYKCALCEFTVEKRPKMTLHLRTKHDQFKKYRCKECKKGTNVYTHFLEHEFIHSQQKPFKCDKCESAFPQKSALNAHHVRMHTYDPVSCDVCKKECRNKMELRSHKTSHEKQSATCLECGKVLSSKDKLRIHMRIHTGEKPYQCQYCDKAFKTSTFRSDHERIHTGDKPHICSICGKGFSQRTSMKVHETTHSTEKPFQCNVCGKSYKSLIMRNGHERKCPLKSTNELRENGDSVQEQQHDDSTPIIKQQDVHQSNPVSPMYVQNNYNRLVYHNQVGYPNMLRVCQPPYQHNYNDGFIFLQNGIFHRVNSQQIQQTQYEEQFTYLQQHRNVVYRGSTYLVPMDYEHQIVVPEEVQESYHQ